ncbi:MAG TPA: S8 family serine peptidase [Puia sp.]|nr:S8 family serine peptidase [Puia sp.]
MTKKTIAAPAGVGVAKKGSGRTGRLLVRMDPKADWKDILKGVDGFVLERLRVGVIEASSAEQVRRMAAAKNSPFVVEEEERRLRKMPADVSGGAGSSGSLGGGRSGGGSSGSGSSGSGRRGGGLPFGDSRVATWGVQAVNVLKSGFIGKGVKVAVLDTGFDFTHVDFADRAIHRKSFIGRQAIDKDGHGTHCAGVAVGGRRGRGGARYGVASGARLYIGKILDDAGEGSDGLALAGIEWALEKGCRVISMSFGASPEEGDGYSAIFESVAQTVMAHRCLLIAATGNDSKRGRIAPVNHPANCPSVMAVGALTPAMKVAEFSCGGVGLAAAVGRGLSSEATRGGRHVAGPGLDGGGQVDIAAPGDMILSAKVGGGYIVESGTSMAAPFVAGVAALLWEQYPGASAWEIWARLTQQAQRLALPASAVGAGLVWVR